MAPLFRKTRDLPEVFLRRQTRSNHGRDIVRRTLLLHAPGRSRRRRRSYRSRRSWSLITHGNFCWWCPCITHFDEMATKFVASLKYLCRSDDSRTNQIIAILGPRKFLVWTGRRELWHQEKAANIEFITALRALLAYCGV